MRRHIIILGCILLLCFGANIGGASGDEDTAECCPPCDSCCGDTCTNLTWECEGPPWSSAECSSGYSCGTGLILGYITGGWSESANELVIHATGSVEFLFTWIPTPDTAQLGTRSLVLESGNYSYASGRLLRDLFDVYDAPYLGALRYDWRACGDSFIYAEGWTERNHAARDLGNGQRAALRNEKLCPTLETSWHGTCLPEVYTVEGCYEIMVPPEIEFFRAHFVSTSDTEWQVIYVDGHRVEVPPLMQEWPEMAELNFVPSGGLVEVCVGREDPWSGGIDISDACIYSNFEATEQTTKRKLSIPAFPKLIFD